MPLRLRLTLAFSLCMTLLLGVLGTFLYLRLASTLLRETDAALRSTAENFAAGVGQGGGNFGDPGAPADAHRIFAQILDGRGRVVEASEGMLGRPLVPPSLTRSVSASVFVNRTAPGVPGISRLLVQPVLEGSERFVVVVGSSLVPRAETLTSLVVLLVVAGSLALVVVSLAGWLLAGAALRPVERMRRGAAAFSVTGGDQRLSVPATGDEIGRLGATLNEMLDRMHQAFGRERRFVDQASHELRTPLGILKAELDLARSRARSPDELRAALESASEEANRLTRLAEDLLVLSRLEGGRLPVHRTELDLTVSLQRVFDAYRAQAAGRGVAVEADVPAGTAYVDGTRLRQALDNLFANALRHTPPGGVVRIRVQRSPDSLLVSVEDSGPGFPPELLDRLFEPFAKARDRAEPDAPRSGLGLTIVGAVAESHGGSVAAGNRSEGGARVTMVLPAGRSVPPPGRPGPRHTDPGIVTRS